jgi:hypothetical protein
MSSNYYGDIAGELADQGSWQADEAARAREEAAREQEIIAENLDARMRAVDPACRDEIDPATGRTWADAAARGMYGERRLRSYRDLCAMRRADRERYRALRDLP